MLSGRIGVYRYVLYSILLAILSVTSNILIPPSPALAALTEQQCYDLNGTVYNNNVWHENRDAQKECISLGYCIVEGNNIGKRVSCSREVYEKSSQYEQEKNDEINRNILDEQTAPLVRVICGNTTAIDCEPAVKSRYQLCANNANDGGSPTQEEIINAISGCMQSWASSRYPNVELEEIRDAVETGLNAGEDRSKEIGQEGIQKKIAECEAQGMTYDSTSDSCVAAPASSCTIPGIGWLVCPVVNFLASIADGIHNFLNEFLEVPAKPIFDQNGDTYKAWSVMRNYANILFVIGFIIIVLSQVTSLGISNYGIKKLLPKLIIVAVLVNLSFPITAILVDLSNIFGYRLSEAVTSLTPKDLQETELKGDLFANGNTFGAIAAFILGATALAAGMYFFLATLIGILISVVVTGVVVVLLLTIRQAVIIMLIVAAPIAFAAMLLPNTEGIYKKWMLIFKSLLLVFPIIGLLYGSAKLASSILMSVGNETGNTLLTLIAAALPILVTVTVVSILKKVLDIIDGGANLATRLQGGLNKIGGVTSGIAKRDKRNRQYLGQGARMRLGRIGSEGSKLRQFGNWAAYGGAAKEQAIKFREADANRNAVDRYSNKVRTDDRYRARMAGGDERLAERALSNADSIQNALQVEEVKADSARIEHLALDRSQLRELAAGRTAAGMNGANASTREAAFQAMAKQGDFEGMNAVWDQLRTDTSQANAETRRAFADAVASSGNAPAYMSQGMLQVMRQGYSLDANGDRVDGISEASGLIATAISNNTYSPDKIINTHQDELRIVQSVVTDGMAPIGSADRQRFSDNAYVATQDDRLNAKIGKNREAIEDISTAFGPR